MHTPGSRNRTSPPKLAPQGQEILADVVPRQGAAVDARHGEGGLQLPHAAEVQVHGLPLRRAGGPGAVGVLLGVGGWGLGGGHTG